MFSLFFLHQSSQRFINFIKIRKEPVWVLFSSDMFQLFIQLVSSLCHYFPSACFGFNLPFPQSCMDALSIWDISSLRNVSYYTFPLSTTVSVSQWLWKTGFNFCSKYSLICPQLAFWSLNCFEVCCLISKYVSLMFCVCLILLWSENVLCRTLFLFNMLRFLLVSLGDVTGISAFVGWSFLWLSIRPGWFRALFGSSAPLLIFCRLFLFFCLFVACGGSQARGPVGAVATGLHHSHCNTGSKLHLPPTLQLTATPDP